MSLTESPTRTQAEIASYGFAKSFTTMVKRVEGRLNTT